ncbi:MAG: hypothetical protein OXN88_10925 [Chloroflexota bacterium]|nr:hypothetical protein [Chloroflexota bacterium]
MSNRRFFQRVLTIMLIAVAALIAGAGSALASVCTLADHIRAVNTNTAVGFCPAGTSHDVITITEDITLSEALPPITGTITIEGGGHTISGADQFRIFDVDGGDLTINHVTVANGRAMSVGRNGFVDYGGALRIRGNASVIINDSVFSNNIGGWGGAIGLEQRGGRLIVNRSHFVDNFSLTNGGAIRIEDAIAEIHSSSFQGNQATGFFNRGGAIYVGNDAVARVTNSSFTGNQSNKGAAVASERWDLERETTPRTTLTHVTMMDNVGQAIFVDEGDKNFNLYNSIIAGKVPGHCTGPLNESIGNLIADGSCAPLLSGDPLLGEMAGSRPYFPLLDGSPALNAADPRFCAETDQRGATRPHGDGCDIGAIESADAIPAPTPVPTVCTLHDQIIAANTDAAYKACPAGNGADTIYMVRDFKLRQALPKITSDITILGQGYTISGGRKFQIFDIAGGSLALSDVTLADGRAANGGAIYLRNSGRASISDVTFSDNRASRGGAVATSGYGNWLNVARSNFSNNYAETVGGAVFADGGQIEISSSAFGKNSARESGGAVYASNGRVRIGNSTLYGNDAQSGGGVYVKGAEVILTHLTLMNNSALRVRGAGVYRESGALYLRNSIIAGSINGDDCYGFLAESRGNFSQDGTCEVRAGGDPRLQAMVESPAHFPLREDSPAHGAAYPSACLETDQLGNPRAHCDIGAIESERDPNNAAVEEEMPDDCTLADQIIATNTDMPSGACPAGNGVDMILLRQNITLTEPLPPINGDLTIIGNGHTISGDNRFRIFDIEGGTVTIKHMTLTNGSSPGGYGGAIVVRNFADFRVSDVEFRVNTAKWGGAIAAIGTSILRVYNNAFLDNAATLFGGAIWADARCMHVDKNVFRRNTAARLSRPYDPDMDQDWHIDGITSGCGGWWSNKFYDT